MDDIEFNDTVIGEESPAYVIAEAGSNHNGDLETAKGLIDAAAEAGADAVKFQTFRADEMYDSESHGFHLSEEDTAYDIFERLEMPYDWIPELHEYCKSNGVQFLSTPFDECSAEVLDEYVPVFKVASSMMSHLPFLEHLATYDKPMIVSTGSHTKEEVAETVSHLEDNDVEDIVLLQCVNAYPTPLEQINVRVVQGLREEFDRNTGLSDHTTDPTTAPAAAVALGATVVEKHFTLDNSMEGPDHGFALEPDELEAMVTAVRNTEAALGDPGKRIVEVERETPSGEQYLHAATDIGAGEELTDENTRYLRPVGEEPGVHPRDHEDLVGSVAGRDLSRGETISWDDIERPDR